MSDVGEIIFNREGYLKLNQLIASNEYSKVLVLTDENTYNFCLPIFDAEVSFSYTVLKINAGESFKNIDTLQFLWQEMTNLNVDRNSVLINLGGGVVSDIGGFAALTFKRGITYINIPTTLLGMVDASIGGKTGIDFNGFKNHIGVISSPKMVIVDPNYLNTLPDRELKSGFAEVLKYGLISDLDLWNRLKSYDNSSVNESFIYRSTEIKNNIVVEDPTEKGLRKTLNFGHTLGHAIESLFLEKAPEERLLHGEAVAIGIILAAFISHQLLNLPEQQFLDIKNTIIRHFGKVHIDKKDIPNIFEKLKQDKKNFDGKIKFVLLREIGECVWNQEVPEDLIASAIGFYNEL